MGTRYNVRKVVRGVAEGAALVCPGSFSFLGDVDLETGEIIAASNPNKGQTLAGRVLIYHESKGSSGGCVVLISLAKLGRAPAALVTVMPADYNLAEGAILAGIPFVCEPDGDVLSQVVTGAAVRVDADNGIIEAG
jgi:uncharacterized protein